MHAAGRRSGSLGGGRRGQRSAVAGAVRGGKRGRRNGVLDYLSQQRRAGRGRGHARSAKGGPGVLKQHVSSACPVAASLPGELVSVELQGCHVGPDALYQTASVHGVSNPART
jgi:hypothetical protein